MFGLVEFAVNSSTCPANSHRRFGGAHISFPCCQGHCTIPLCIGSAIIHSYNWRSNWREGAICERGYLTY
jgi:hypothetical protein